MNPQNILRTVFAASAIVACVLTVKDHNQTIKNERAKREEIKRNTQRELLALARANLIVQKKVLVGDYDRNLGRAIGDIQNDMKFYRIVDRFND